MKTTTLSLDDDLIQAVENQARHTGQTPDQVIEHVLREALLEKSPGKSYKLR
jgi:predicted transcriptional regulator